MNRGDRNVADYGRYKTETLKKMEVAAWDHIGDDVVIAPNAFVNIDVPDHSVVMGNPCIIHHKENATEGYLGNID